VKNPKKLTYHERQLVQSWGLDPEKYRRVKYIGGSELELINIESGQTVKIFDRKPFPAEKKEFLKNVNGETM
jgi:hypothetical protein